MSSGLTTLGLLYFLTCRLSCDEQAHSYDPLVAAPTYGASGRHQMLPLENRDNCQAALVTEGGSNPLTHSIASPV